MNRTLLITALAVALSAGVALHAQATNDSWEPNNSLTAAQTNQINIPSHIGSQGWIAGFGFAFGQNGTRRQYESLLITPNDNDWFRVPGGAIPNNGTPTLSVYMNQTGGTAFELEVEITDDQGNELAGPTNGTYTTLSTANGNPYDGKVATTNVTAGSDYFIHVWYPSTSTPSMSSGTTVPYDLSIELHTGGSNTDSSEGNNSNNFPSYSPNPNFTTGNPADVTPGSPGTTVTRSNHTWNGWDYYMVNLPTAGAIEVNLTNLNPAQNANGVDYNFDVYWVDSSGVPYSGTPPGTALGGASDSFPQGLGGGVATVTNPNASETLTTGPLTAGAYYFQVVCWDLSQLPQVGFPYRGGSYTIDFTYSTVNDDGHEPNNDAANASPLSTGNSGQLYLLGDTTGTEEDWYAVSVADGQNIEVVMTLDVPASDNLQIELYQPNSTNPGQAADRVDLSIINNRDTQTKGSTTASETVGSWGTVGPSGNTGWDAGDWLIRIYRSGSVIDGGYQLDVTVNGTVNIAPEDNFEPNNNFAQVTDPANTYLELPGGLTNGLKAMDFQDWYRVPNVSDGDNVAISMIYDANATTDIDLIVIDLDGGPNIGQGQLSFLGTPDWTNENTANSIVTVNGTAGLTYQGSGTNAPSSGDIYVVVQRWNSQGVEYALNVNIAGANPLPVLRINSITTNPGSVTAPGSTDVTVAVENTSNQAEDLDSLSLTLTHSGGANVTSEYTITGPTPALPQSIAANSTETFDFTVTSTTSSTNGTITVTASGTDGNGTALLGNPSGSFTLAGGQNPAPNLVYSGITVSGNLIGGGTASVNATVENTGTLGGTYGDDGSLAFAFDQGGTDVTAMFTLSGGPNPALPRTIAAGQSETISWSFQIDIATPLGPTNVTISGGGNDNPASGSGSFTVSSLNLNAGGGGGGCAGLPARAPWLLFVLMMLGVGAWIYRTRLAEA